MGFKPAEKMDAKARVAFIGPAGSGKSLMSLRLAKLLAGENGKIAAIDTEGGTLSKYADLFKFDVDTPSAFTAEYWLAQLTEAEKSGYSVFLTDSLSHFWMGEGGALEFVDEHSSVNRDKFAGWKAWRPFERQMMSRMLASPCHIICTMRTRNEYVDEVDEKGKKKRRKIGLKPEQRDGLEYEFDLVALMNDDCSMSIDKSRVMLTDGSSPYANRTFQMPKADVFTPFVDWLSGKKPEPPKPILEGFRAMLSDESADQIGGGAFNLESLNSKVMEAFKAVPKDHPERAAVTEMIRQAANKYGCTYNREKGVWEQNP